LKGKEKVVAEELLFAIENGDFIEVE